MIPYPYKIGCKVVKGTGLSSPIMSSLKDQLSFYYSSVDFLIFLTVAIFHMTNILKIMKVIPNIFWKKRMKFLNL